MSYPINRIVILGGGTAGWITAGILAAHLRQKYDAGYTITLIESSNIPPIGVGEGTWPTMRRTLKKIGVRESDFINQCNVSFKQGAKFVKWTTGMDDDYYYHPLMMPQDFDKIDLAQFWQQTYPTAPFADVVCPQGSVCDNHLAPKYISTAEYASVANYAYHLDAGRFSEFLKQHCINKLNVTHIVDDVVAINNGETGDIQSLTTVNHGDITADFFIDCSGTKSLLLGEHFQVAFKSCKDTLFIDKALAVQVPYQDELSPIVSHTVSTAQTAGWIWDIGLANRRGVGHVYSTQHISDELAYQQLIDYLKPSVDNVDALTIRTIPINPGHRESFWHRNCAAVGLSAGFLEPLEASALLLVEISTTMIAEQLPVNRSSMDIIAKRFNETLTYHWDRIIDFLKLHYVLNQRNDSQFWIDHRLKETIPESLQSLLEQWKHQAPADSDFARAVEVFPAASYQYVLYGMGFNTQPHHFGLSNTLNQQASHSVDKNINLTKELVSTLPTNRAILKLIAQYGLQKI